MHRDESDTLWLDGAATRSADAAAVRTTDEYIASFPEEVRPILGEVAAALRRALPGAEERIRYGMPAFMLTDRYALHFAGWKQHVGLYPVGRLDPDLEAEVGPYRAQKDTVKLLLPRPRSRPTSSSGSREHWPTGTPSRRFGQRGVPRRGYARGGGDAAARQRDEGVSMSINDDDITSEPAPAGEGVADGGANPGGHDGGADGSAGEGPADGGANAGGHDGGADGSAGEGPADGGANAGGHDGGADGSA